MSVTATPSRVGEGRAVGGNDGVIVIDAEEVERLRDQLCILRWLGVYLWRIGAQEIEHIAGRYAPLNNGIHVPFAHTSSPVLARGNDCA